MEQEEIGKHDQTEEEKEAEKHRQSYGEAPFVGSCFYIDPHKLVAFVKYRHWKMSKRLQVRRGGRGGRRRRGEEGKRGRNNSFTLSWVCCSGVLYRVL